MLDLILLDQLPDTSNKYNIEFYLTHTAEGNILTFSKNINTFKAVGINRLWGRFLKDAIAVLVKSLSKICNLLIVFKSFPHALELSKLRFDRSSYRTVSWLLLLSKTTEGVDHDETTTFLNQNSISYTC